MALAQPYPLNFDFIDRVATCEVADREETCGGLLEWCISLDGVTELNGPVFKYAYGENLFSVELASRICHCYIRKPIEEREIGLSLSFGIRKVCEYLQAELILVLHHQPNLRKQRTRNSMRAVTEYHKHTNHMVEATARVGEESTPVSILRTMLGGLSGQGDRYTRHFPTKAEFEQWVGTIQTSIPQSGFRLDPARVACLEKAVTRVFGKTHGSAWLPRSPSALGFLYRSVNNSLDPIHEQSYEPSSQNSPQGSFQQVSSQDGGPSTDSPKVTGARDAGGQAMSREGSLLRIFQSGRSPRKSPLLRPQKSPPLSRRQSGRPRKRASRALLAMSHEADA